ncbi:MAG: response regulator [Fibrobacterota bacterium]|nr:MAG: response regulator [Fibrobacterota bacterium]
MNSPASILLVDDTPTNLVLLGSILEKAGFEIRVATNGPDALAIAASQPSPGLILLDILMPEMDGFEICRRLKSDPHTSGIPVIFVTALGQVTDKVKAFKTGAVDFISKPFESEEVIARVRTHLSLAHMESLLAEIEERKRSEKALAESQALLALSQAEARKQESLGLMAGGIAHDFNNLLGVIIGHAEIAQRKTPEGSPVAKGLAAVLKAANRSAELTRQLLAFASRDTIRPEVLVADTAIGSILDGLRKDLRAGMSLEWKPGADTCRIRVDRAHLEQILSRLCANAAEASGETGSIAVGTSVEDLPAAGSNTPNRPHTECRLAITFRDEGQGIPPDLVGRIFDPFFTTKPRGKGVGLGLSTVLGAVRQNDGLIEVESGIGRGTTFRILFPCCRSLLKAAPQPSQGPASNPGGEMILVVEDHPDVLAMTTMILEHQGFQVLATVNPWHALDLLRKHKDTIRLILTDVVMPGMNGRELVLQAREMAPSLRYIYCSGYTADVLDSRGPACEGMDFIQKPYSIVELHRKIREVLDRP